MKYLKYYKDSSGYINIEGVDTSRKELFGIRLIVKKDSKESAQEIIDLISKEDNNDSI